MKFSMILCLGLGWLMTAVAAESKPIAVTIGQEFKIKLKSNATTGYHWQLAKPPDQKFLKFRGSEYKQPDSKLVGAGGHEVWTFKALATGKTAVALDYVRPWEKDIKPVQSTNFVVIVKAKKAKGS